MASLSGNTLQNTFFTNISSVIFDADTYYGIAQGLGFITTTKLATWNDVRDDFDTFSRRIYYYDYFSELDLSADAQSPGPKFRIPNPGWHPKTSGTEYSATYGVEEYITQTRENVKKKTASKTHSVYMRLAPPTTWPNGTGTRSADFLTDATLFSLTQTKN
jgi:hypothetical protein